MFHTWKVLSSWCATTHCDFHFHFISDSYILCIHMFLWCSLSLSKWVKNAFILVLTHSPWCSLSLFKIVPKKLVYFHFPKLEGCFHLTHRHVRFHVLKYIFFIWGSLSLSKGVKNAFILLLTHSPWCSLSLSKTWRVFSSHSQWCSLLLSIWFTGLWCSLSIYIWFICL